MKNLKFISAITVLFLLLVSCSSDDGKDGKKDIDTNLLIGSWQSDNDPGYGDPTFYENGRVEFHFLKEEWGDDFSEWGDWELNDNYLKITWDESDLGLEIYNPRILSITKTNLAWEVDIDGDMSKETFTRK